MSYSTILFNVMTCSHSDAAGVFSNQFCYKVHSAYVDLWNYSTSYEYRLIEVRFLSVQWTKGMTNEASSCLLCVVFHCLLDTSQKIIQITLSFRIIYWLWNEGNQTNEKPIKRVAYDKHQFSHNAVYSTRICIIDDVITTAIVPGLINLVKATTWVVVISFSSRAYNGNFRLLFLFSEVSKFSIGETDESLERVTKVLSEALPIVPGSELLCSQNR